MDYSYGFQDNIPYSMFNSTSNNVLNWIKENRDAFDWAKDPNSYEMTNLFLFGAKYAHEGRNVDTDALTEMWDIRSKDFARCNIDQNNLVYVICQDAYQAAVSGKSMVDDENSHHALRKIAGIDLFLKQQQRDNGEISYNNPRELLQLLQCSTSLKTLHPYLFKRYSFDENIHVLCKLQLQHELPSEISQSIKDAENQVSSKALPQKSDIDVGDCEL